MTILQVCTVFCLYCGGIIRPDSYRVEAVKKEEKGVGCWSVTIEIYLLLLLKKQTKHHNKTKTNNPPPQYTLLFQVLIYFCVWLVLH